MGKLKMRLSNIGQMAVNIMAVAWLASGIAVAQTGKAGGIGPINGGGKGGTATTPGGSNGQVQFNNAGAFGGNSGFTFNSTTGNVAIGNAVLLPVTISTSGPVTAGAGGFYLNNASGALTYNLPTITSALVGLQMCFRNATGKTGAITLQLPSSTTADVMGAVGSSAGTLVSGGALGDAVCVVAVSTTQYLAYIGSGTWTNN